MKVRRCEVSGGDGRGYEILLDAAEFAILEDVFPRLREILLHPERSRKVIDRLFPPAHLDDAEAQREFRRLMGETLLQTRLAAMAEFEKTLARADSDELPARLKLTEEEANLWLHVINDMRLMLALELGITENDWELDPPQDAADVPAFVMLLELTDMQHHLIEVLRRSMS